MRGFLLDNLDLKNLRCKVKVEVIYEQFTFGAMVMSVELGHLSQSLVTCGLSS